MGETLPPTWAQQVRNSVARIRGRLGHDAILTEATDYRLGIDAETIDAVRFERLVSEARGHALRDDHDRAVDGYRKALALWRGEPLQDVADWEPGVVEAMRLGEIRTSVQEELLDERLRAGRRAVTPRRNGSFAKSRSARTDGRSSRSRTIARIGKPKPWRRCVPPARGSRTNSASSRERALPRSKQRCSAGRVH